MTSSNIMFGITMSEQVSDEQGYHDQMSNGIREMFDLVDIWISI